MAGLAESLGISSSPYINAVVVLLVFVAAAWLADLFVDRLLRRVARFTKTELDDRIIDLVHRPVFLTIVLAGLSAAASYLVPAGKLLFYADGVLYSLIVVIWGVTMMRATGLVIEHAVGRVSDVTGLGRNVIPLVENLTKIVVVLAVLLLILSLWKVNITPLVASAGIAGAVVAFAAKDTMANLFGGISVFMDRPFKIGDYIVLDQGERGEVVAIGIRSTRIKTRDDILITIPNSIIANTKIINESAPVPKFRIRVPVSVAYGSDIDLVEQILLEIAAANGNVIEDPPPRVRFRQFGDSSLNFELLCWAREPALRGLTVHELNRSIYKTFQERGVKIPFPQRDVHLYRE